VDVKPLRIGGPPPHYPDELRQNGVGGRVVVEFIVGFDGRVEFGSVRALQYTDYLFVAPTIEAIRAQVYCPAVRRGVPVRYHVRQPVNYQIRVG
jgi:protein TonB